MAWHCHGMTNETNWWYVMTGGPIDPKQHTVASFGPFHDLALAKLAVQRLLISGVKSSVHSEEYAKQVDVHGVSQLRIKNPNGIDWG